MVYHITYIFILSAVIKNLENALLSSVFIFELLACVCIYCGIGGNAWTASSSDFDQHLIIDLGQVMNVTSLATQGRPHSSEYVMEYGISYGTNGLDYADYKEEDGNVKVN